MAGKTRGLGKGLDLLIPDAVGEAKAKKETAEPVQDSGNSSADGSRETLVKITAVEPNRKQPRKTFDEDALQELSSWVVSCLARLL